MIEVSKKVKTLEKNRVARQTMMNNILKVDQNNSYAILLLIGVETSNDAKKRV